MSNRSTQAFNLARYLTGKAGVDVELSYDTGKKWYVAWGGGPTREQMQALIAEALTHTHHFGLMLDRQLQTSRGESTRSWAARAIAAYSDGSLAEKVARGADRRRAMGLDDKKPRVGRYLSPEWYEVMSVVQQLIDTTANPDRPDDPEQLPLIEQLLTAGQQREGDMADILVNQLRAPQPGQGPALHAVGEGQHMG